MSYVSNLHALLHKTQQGAAGTKVPNATSLGP